MEPSSLRTFFTLLCAFLFFQSRANTTLNIEEVKTRLGTMECIVTPRYTPAVEGYIKGYLGRSPGKAERVMGRAVVFFPIFEKYLEEHNLPKDIKYLAIVESALIPKALSPVGAGGLWQFMKETGRAYDLEINSEVDERSCTHRSTDAAMKYLARQYEYFGSWELALAAYNCGAGNIMKAIKRARTNDYWKLAKYLPRETRNFVPAFLGAAYLVNYYHLHDVKPEYPDLDMQLTEETLVFSKIDFATIAAVTALPVEIVAELNPAFKKNYIPENETGHYMLLPRRVMPAFEDYIETLRPDNANNGNTPELPELVDTSNYRPEEYYFESHYTVSEGDGIEALAKLFKCSSYHLKAWNELTSSRLTKGQDLIVWFPRETLYFRKEHQKVDMMAHIQSTLKSTSFKKLPQPKLKPVIEVKQIRADQAKAIPYLLDPKPLSFEPLVARNIAELPARLPAVEYTPAADEQSFGDKVKDFIKLDDISIKLPSLFGGKTKAEKK